MTTFDQSLHPPGSGGKFATKQYPEPAAEPAVMYFDGLA